MEQVSVALPALREALKLQHKRSSEPCHLAQWPLHCVLLFNAPFPLREPGFHWPIVILQQSYLWAQELGMLLHTLETPIMKIFRFLKSYSVLVLLWLWLCMRIYLCAALINLALLPSGKTPDVLWVFKCLSSEHDGVVAGCVAAWLGTCFGASIDTVLQNDIWGRDLSPYASQSHQVLQPAPD